MITSLHFLGGEKNLGQDRLSRRYCNTIGPKAGHSPRSPPLYEGLNQPMSNQTALLQVRVDPALREAFEAHAAAKGLKSSELLRRLVQAELALQGELQALVAAPTGNALKTERIYLRLPAFIADAVRARASVKGMQSARWVAALVQSHIDQQPVMTAKEVELLRAMNRELAAIGRNVNQVAKQLNSAVGDIERGRINIESVEKVIPAISLSRKILNSLIRKSQQSWEAVDD
jgi:predicted DNA binding CopG/RHH family protein